MCALPTPMSASTISVCCERAKSVPSAALTTDLPVPPLPLAVAEQIKRRFESEGATAKISSIHVNGWFGSYDKLTMSRLLLREIFNIDMDVARSQIVFVGDSPNDSPMFGFFPNAVGVANVFQCRDRLAAEPAWVTQKPGGEGFSELVDILLVDR